jgi:hypothetical protein
VLILNMIEVLPPLGNYKYDTWRILSVKCYIDNSVRLWSCIRNINTWPAWRNGEVSDLETSDEITTHGERVQHLQSVKLS